MVCSRRSSPLVGLPPNDSFYFTAGWTRRSQVNKEKTMPLFLLRSLMLREYGTPRGRKKQRKSEREKKKREEFYIRVNKM